MDINELFSKYQIPGALALVGVVLILGGLFLSSHDNKPKTVSFPKESLIDSQKITVDVSGAVENPGVYQLDNQSRVEDALKVAGGLSLKSNIEYISKSLNLAQKISDGMKIYIPFEGEQMGGVAGGIVAGVNVQASGKVNINTGTQTEMEGLPGIGPVTAGKIISGRPYSKIEDLLDQKIVSKAIFEKIKDIISL